MIGSEFNKPSNKKGTFTSPEKLPANTEDAENWQEANKSFWESNSMRYDWREPIKFKEFSREFYEEIDRRFLTAVKAFMPWKVVPFEQWLDPATLKNKDVLEIGVGNGTHAQLIAPKSKSYTGIDLTEYATQSTRKRLELFKIDGTIHRMDAERLDFPDASFDFIWSWGVIHHSANTNRVLDEMQRVLRDGGKAVTMVYFRSWFSYYFIAILLGIVKGYFFRGKTIHKIAQGKSDGALARFYTIKSWSDLVGQRFKIKRIEILGNKTDVIPLPAGNLKTAILKFIPTIFARFMLKNLRMGSFLICEMTK